MLLPKTFDYSPKQLQEKGRAVQIEGKLEF